MTNLEDLNEILHCVRVQPLPTIDEPRRPQRDPPLCPCSTVSIQDGNLEDLNEILLCVRVRPFPTTTETLKTSSNNQLHPAAKQLDDRMPQQTPTPMPTPVTLTQIQRAHPFLQPNECTSQSNGASKSSNRWRRRRIKKNNRFSSQRTTTTVVCGP